MPTKRFLVAAYRLASIGVAALLLLRPPSISTAFAQATDSTASPARSTNVWLDDLFDLLRERNGRDYSIATPDGIDEAKFVEIGGIEQWITIRGENRNSPVLLFLHGGPGDASNPYGYAIFRPWLKYFTVVQWDQRGTGQTLSATGPSIGSTMTIERMVNDGLELTDLLRNELGQQKVVLVGHSWGSTLGVLMAKARPSLFCAFVGTGQVADPIRSDSVAYAELLDAAEQRREQVAVQELRQVGPPPWTDARGYQTRRKWANLFEQADVFLASTVTLALTAPGYSLGDAQNWLDGQILSGSRLVPQTRSFTSAMLGGTFSVPVFVFQGAEDFTTPTSLARDFINSIEAPEKGFVAIQDAGHFAVFTKPDAFLRELVDRVLPLGVSHGCSG